MKVTVNVTQEDIRSGSHCGGDCPCTRGARRVLPQLPRLHFGAFEWWPFGVVDESDFRLPIPPEAGEWITAYDRSGRAEPFTFELDVPDDLLAEVTP